MATRFRAAGACLRIFLSVLLLGLLPAASAWPAGAAGQRTVTVAADDNYPPYIFRNSTGGLEGYLVDMWRLWEKKTGVAVDLAATDWSKAQAMLAAGKADVIDTIFRTPERERYLEFSRPYAVLAVPIYVHRDIGGITDVESLRGFLVGVKAGDACADHLKESGISTLEEFASYQQVVDGAAAGRVKVFCLDEDPANYLLYRAGIFRDYRKAFVLYRGEFHRAVRRGNGEVLRLVQQGFDAIGPDEESALRQKWMGNHFDLSGWKRYLLTGILLALIAGGGIAVWIMLLRAEVRRRTAELVYERGRLRTLIDTLPDLVWLKDPDGVYLACNAEFERFFGAKEADILGRTDYDFVPAELAGFFRQKDLEAIAAGGPKSNEEEVVYADDGHRVLLETIKTPMFDAHGKLVGVLGIGRDITARRAAELAVAETQERFKVAFRASPVAASITRASDGRFLDINDKYLRDFGWSKEEIIGRSSLEVGLWPDAEARLRWLRKLHEKGTVVDYETVWHDRERRPRRVCISAELTNLHGEPHIFSFTVDITERAEREAELRLAAQVYENAAEGIIITEPSGEIVAVNRAFSEITGYSPAEALGRKTSMLRSGRHEPIFYQELWAALIETGVWQGEIWNRRKNGEIYPEWLTISTVRNDDGKAANYVALFSDITTVKRSQEALNFLAHHDHLTGLPNRTLLRDRLGHALQRAQREGGRLAVLFIDLDRFKQINDTLGHPVGDDILRLAAQAMSAQVRASDTVARIGGDEFVILLEDEASVHGIATVAHKLVERFTQPFEVKGRELYVTASLGISLYPNDGGDADTLLKHADLAMYKAKEHGRNNFQFYEAAMGAGAFERMIVENALRGAVQRRELLLHYQPQVDLATGVLAGVEALVRWQHPELGLVPPGRFIPVAEDMGIIADIGDWVLREACRQVAEWKAAGFSVPRVSVNISVQQLETVGLVGLVERLLDDWSLPPEQLELEVTESMIMHRTGPALEILEGLRRLGVYLAVDDFGIGYSSLSYLKQLPVHRLKIDYSFVRDIGRDANDEAIARAIIGLGRSLGLEVVAEGVEREEQAAFLRREACDIAQGYLYGRPVAPPELLASWRTAAAPGEAIAGAQISGPGAPAR